MLSLIYILTTLIVGLLCVDTNRQFILHPTPVANISVKQQVNSVGLMLCVQEDETYAYITSAQNGVHIVDLSQIELPKIISAIPTGYAQHCDVRNNYLFIADQQEGLVIADVSNKTSPKRIAQIAFQGIDGLQKAYQYVTLSQDFKYVFTLSYGFVFTYDITTPSNPKFTFVVAAPTLFAPNSYRLKFDKTYQYIAVANHLTGVTIIDIREIANQKVRFLQNPLYVTWDCLFTPDNTAFFALDIYFGVFYLDPTNVFSFSKGVDGMVSSATFTNAIPATDSLFMTMVMTRDGTHLLIGHRSMGLTLYKFAYDSVNSKFIYSTPIFVEHLNGDYMVLSMYTSINNDQYIYVADGITFTIYQSVTPNINQDFPHFFNTFQSALTYLTPELSRFGLKCLASSVIVSNPLADIRIYDITDPFYPNLLSTIKKVDHDLDLNLDQISVVETSTDEKQLYVITATTGVVTFNIQDKTHPTPLDQYIFKNNGAAATQFTGIKFSPDRNSALLSNSFYGAVLLHNVKSTLFSQVTSMQIYAGSLACGIEKCVFTSDGLKLICACREVGTLFYTIGSNLLFTWSYLFNEMGCEGLAINSSDTLLFIANGFQGLFILDISNFSQPVQLSQLVLSGGWSQEVYLLFSEQYIIVAETDKGQLNLINIQDSKNPYIQQKIQFQHESSTNVCIVPNTNSMFYLGNAGLRYQPILPGLQIHSQFQLQILSSDGTFLYYKTLAQGTSLLVGEKIKITFTPLYTQQHINVANVYYYRYFEKQALPSWITYLQTSGEITIAVDKLGTFNDFSTEKKGENILVLEAQIQVQSTDLAKTGLITPTLAAQLVSLLQQSGYLDSQGYVTTLFDPTVPFAVGTYSSDIQNQMKEVLTFSKIEYPIRFFIVSSLIFNFGTSSSRLLASSTDIISTPSQQVSIYMQINSNGVFVKKVFEGVLTSFSDDLTSVKISGQTSYVNNILSNYIQVSNSTTDLSQVSLTFLLSDSNNYDQTINTSLDKVGFISIHKPVILNEKLSPQLDSYYSNGGLPIEDRFSFTFDPSSFTQGDGLPITYTAFILNGEDKPTQIQTGGWIEFNNLNLGFSGIITASHYQDNYWIRVIATDGYSSAQDDFNITFNLVPFFYAFQLIVQIVGPLIGIIGLWQYRYQIHLFVAERRNMYKNEVAVIGKMFKKQIILFGSVQRDVLILWKSLLKSSKTLKSELVEEYKLNKSIDVYSLVSRMEREYQSKLSKFNLLDPREFDFDDSRLVRSVKRLAYQVILESDKSTFKVFKLLKQHTIKSIGKKDWYKALVEVTPIMEIKNNEVLHREQKEKGDKQNNNILKGNNDEFVSDQNIVRHRDQTQLQKIDSNNKDIDELVTPKNHVQLTQKNNELFSDKNLQQNPLSEVDLKKPQVFSEEYEGKPNADAHHNFSLYTNLNAFPDITIKSQNIDNILRSHECKQSYDLILLSEIIALEASGTMLENPSSFNPSQGESIHLYPYDLFTLSAFRKGRDKSWVTSILDFLNMRYSSIALVNNDPLPKWLNYQIVDGIINIWGVPQPSDEEELLIRIINTTGFAINSFHIFIKDFQGNDMRDKGLIRKATMGLGLKPALKMNKQVHSSMNILGQGQSPQHQQTLHLIKQSSSQHLELPSVKMIQLQTGGQSSLQALESNTRQQNYSAHQLKPFQLNQIEEEKPEHLKEFISVISGNKSNQNKNQKQRDDNSSIIIDIDFDHQLEFNDKEEVKTQQFKNMQS